MTNTVNMRELALETLLAISRDGRQSHLIIRDLLDKYSYLDARDKAFYVRLTEGTLEYRIQLDYIIDQFSGTKTRKMKPVIREILRMTVYQIKYMDSVPDSAACNEAVKLAVRKGFKGLKGFVNGVSRSVARGIRDVKYPGKDQPVNYLKVRYSMPEYLVEKWIEEYGFETTEKICGGFYRQRPVTVRFRGQGEKPDYLTKAPYARDAWYMEGGKDLTELEAFADGSLIVQDVSSNAAVRAIGIKPGDFVVDLCAAPGGKSILAADLTGPTGKVISRDLTEFKTDRIKENMERCRITWMEAQEWDATEADPEMIGKADVVIADVPCTGYGVMGKKPDIRYRATEENQQELIRIQRAVLANAVSYVKPGGRLLFSTCTFGHAENADTFRWLKENFDLEPLDLTGNLEEDLLAVEGIRESAKEGYAELLPGLAECDGFFFSVFSKK